MLITVVVSVRAYVSIVTNHKSASVDELHCVAAVDGIWL